ncbi:MAG TPA: bifunctional DNA-formamidopyrimidine glycosylase/DNA-(apurinic or apyrimidinic site) lyase [Armatimonadaceae bacterium]|nr:bifunctional DNA-formamidopyrimidine glycosylase/DNA-(apurinic or apyrimidinic site) lyase [Armatimonadaceae bacterium]
MPELPEVETLRRGLERRTLHRRIGDVVVVNERVLKGQSPSVFRERVVGTRVTEVRRRGKYLLVRLDAAEPASPSSAAKTAPPTFLCIHLKMRGQLLLETAATPAGRYHCVTLRLDAEGDAEVELLRFYDMWTWGEMRALTEEELAVAVPALEAMGPEPLEEAWGGGELAARLLGRRTAIKSTLLDQRVVAGVGNIYADESLFRARIHPERQAGTLTREEADILSASIRSVLTEAVEGHGTGSDEYTDLAGMSGGYTPKVYDRGGQPCPECGTALSRIRLGGRGTVFCGDCQPEAGQA